MNDRQSQLDDHEILRRAKLLIDAHHSDDRHECAAYSEGQSCCIDWLIESERRSFILSRGGGWRSRVWSDNRPIDGVESS